MMYVRGGEWQQEFSIVVLGGKRLSLRKMNVLPNWHLESVTGGLTAISYPFPAQANVNRVTCSLKDGLDLNKLSTTGTDFEVVDTDDPYIEDEEEVEEKLRYRTEIVDHLKPECADFCEECDGEDNGNDSDPALASFIRKLLEGGTK